MLRNANAGLPSSASAKSGQYSLRYVYSLAIRYVTVTGYDLLLYDGDADYVSPLYTNLNGDW